MSDEHAPWIDPELVAAGQLLKRSRRVRLGRRCHDACDDCRQLCGIDGLGHVHVVTRRERQHPILNPAIGRQGDGGRFAAPVGIQRANVPDEARKTFLVDR
jgi:hypothetical protein